MYYIKNLSINSKKAEIKKHLFTPVEMLTADLWTYTTCSRSCTAAHHKMSRLTLRVLHSHSFIHSFIH